MFEMTKIVSTVDVALKLIIALAVAYTGYQFSNLRQKNDDARFVIDLALSSDPPKAVAGISLAKEYLHDHRISNELYSSIIVYANATADPRLSAAANANAQSATKTNDALRRDVLSALGALPVRIFLQVSRESDRARSQSIGAEMQAASTGVIPGYTIAVQGTELVKPTPTAPAVTLTEVRCFKPTECKDLAPSLVGYLTANNVASKVVDLSKAYSEAEIRPNQLEVWFAPFSQPQTRR